MPQIKCLPYYMPHEKTVPRDKRESYSASHNETSTRGELASINILKDYTTVQMMPDDLVSKLAREYSL